MKNNPLTLSRLEKVLAESQYVIRYERGNFQSGYCILEERKIIVLNRFLNLEGRVNTLFELIPQLKISFDLLTYESQKAYEEVMKKSATEAP